MYGNSHGLPGLPQTRYVAVGGSKPPRNSRPSPSPQPTFNPPPLQPSPSMLPGPDPMTSRRIDMLEQRLNSMEQSNRALLDELMRLQQDIKVNVKKNEMGLNEEREHRSRLEMSVRQSQGKMYETDDRIRRLEEGVKENRATVTQLSSHAKTIEKAVASSQQDQMERRSDSAQKLQEYRHEMIKVLQTTEQLERLCHSVRDEAHDSTNRIETLSQDILSLQSGLKLQARLMEDTNKKRRPNADENKPTLTDGERVVMEGKIIQLNSTIQDMSSRLSDETKKREKIEADLNKKVNELLEDMDKSKGEKDKEDKEYDDKMKEIKAGFSESEKQRIMMEMSSLASDLYAKLDEREAKLRDDTINKLIVIENTLNQENLRRADKEKLLEEKFESTNKEIKVQGDEGSNALKSAFDQHVLQNRDKISELNNRLTDMEEDISSHKVQTEKVLAAEITYRENQDKILDSKIESVEDHMKMGLASLQGSIGDLDNKAKSSSSDPKSARSTGGPNLAELQKIQEETEDNIRVQVRKDLSEFDERLSKVETTIKHKDEEFDNKLQTMKTKEKEANSALEDKMQQKVDSVLFQQNKMQKQVTDLKEKMEDTPKNIEHLREQLGETESRLNKKLDEERKSRMDDVEENRANIERIMGRKEQAGVSVPSLARLEQNIEETQTGMKKLAEAVHVVKSSLGEKIKDETKLREQENKLLNREVERLDTKYRDVKDEVKKISLASEENNYGY